MPESPESRPAAEANVSPSRMVLEPVDGLLEAQLDAGFSLHGAREEARPVPLRGDFSRTPFPEVLGELHRRKANGALLIRRGTVKKIVYLRDGVPRFVKSNLLGECLGRVMVNERLISEADCEESIRRMKASRRQQGEVLLEMKVINPNNLAYALKLQQRVMLFEVFTWRSGQYQLTPQKEPPAETVHLDMSAAAIVAEGVKRAYDRDRVSAALGNVDGLFAHRSGDPRYALRNLELDEEEQQLLQAVDGRKTLATLRGLDLLPPLDVDRLIYAMCCMGLVELRLAGLAVQQRSAESPSPGHPARGGATGRPGASRCALAIDGRGNNSTLRVFTANTK